MNKPLNPLKAIDWNSVSEPLDLEVWNRITAQFWLPEVVSLSSDLPSWATLTDREQLTVMRVFTGLTLLDTMQSNTGAVEMMQDARTPHEEAVLTNFAFMESVHAKSYSSIFSTLANSTEIKAAFKWSEENEYLQNKARIVHAYYKGDCPHRRKIASVALELFLFMSGFYAAFRYSSRGKLTAVADIIRLILRDEVVHGLYIGTKFQYGFAELPASEQDELRDYAYELLMELYDNEILYVRDLYDELGWTADVLPYMRYNLNRALSALGFDPLFPADDCQVAPEILASMDPGGNENHDFFSGSGSSYVIGKQEETTDDDWSFDD